MVAGFLLYLIVNHDHTLWQALRFSWSSCQPVLLHVTWTCWKFQTHISNLAVLLSQLQRLFLKFRLFVTLVEKLCITPFCRHMDCILCQSPIMERLEKIFILIICLFCLNFHYYVGCCRFFCCIMPHLILF